MITSSTLPPTAGERLQNYYSALPLQGDFHPVAHAARAARGLAVVQRMPKHTGRTARRAANSAAPSDLRGPGSVQADFSDPMEGDPATLPHWHPDSLQYAGI